MFVQTVTQKKWVFRSSVLKYSQVTEALQSWGEHTKAQRCRSGWPPGQLTEQCCHPVRYERMTVRWWVWAETDKTKTKHKSWTERERRKGYTYIYTYILTLSVRVASQPGTDSSWRTMSRLFYLFIIHFQLFCMHSIYLIFHGNIVVLSFFWFYMIFP